MVESELSMVLVDCYHISFVRFFSRAERAKMFNHTTDLNVRIPIHGSLIQVCPFEAGSACLTFGIKVVLSSCRFTKISNCIVAAIAVFVI